MQQPTTALIAIGGNALIREGEHGTIPEQRHNLRRTAAALVQAATAGFRLVITHGNGPQVGAAMLRSERAADRVYPHPLDVCDATTQGEIGYLLQQALESALAESGLRLPVATLITQVRVAPDDPALNHPTKPVGPFYSREEADSCRARLGWRMVEVNGRGFRRVVPSPAPLEIVEEEAIRQLFEAGVLVIAAGGGGIPVVRRGTGLAGIEAVVDKDATSALLATRLRAERLVIAMEADQVCLHYGSSRKQPLDRVSAAQLERYRQDDHFPPGSMGPKVEAALRFLRDGGRDVVITSIERLPAAVRGAGGTHIVP